MLTLGTRCRYFFVALLHKICQSVHLLIIDQTIKGTHVPIKTDSSLTHVHSSAHQALADWWYWGQCIGWKSEDRKKDRSKWNTPYILTISFSEQGKLIRIMLWYQQRWQVHCHGLWRQKGNSLRSDVLNLFFLNGTTTTTCPILARITLFSLYYLYLPSLSPTITQYLSLYFVPFWVATMKTKT